jgi:hypothetical protein
VLCITLDWAVLHALLAPRASESTLPYDDELTCTCGQGIATLLLGVDLCIVHGGYHKLPAASAVLFTRHVVTN